MMKSGLEWGAWYRNQSCPQNSKEHRKLRRPLLLVNRCISFQICRLFQSFYHMCIQAYWLLFSHVMSLALLFFAGVLCSACSMGDQEKSWFWPWWGKQRKNHPFPPTVSHKPAGPKLKLGRKKAIHCFNCMLPGVQLFRDSYQNYKNFNFIPFHIASSKFHVLEISPRLVSMFWASFAINFSLFFLSIFFLFSISFFSFFFSPFF